LKTLVDTISEHSRQMIMDLNIDDVEYVRASTSANNFVGHMSTWITSGEAYQSLPTLRTKVDEFEASIKLLNALPKPSGDSKASLNEPKPDVSIESILAKYTDFDINQRTAIENDDDNYYEAKIVVQKGMV
jgi:phage shock protein A